MHLDFLGLDYLGLAYLVTALVLGWDYLSPRLQLLRVRRAIAQRQRRNAARQAGST
jgi:hypothetical protein